MKIENLTQLIMEHLKGASVDCPDDALLGTVEGGLSVILERMKRIDMKALTFGVWLQSELENPVFPRSVNLQKTILEAWVDYKDNTYHTTYVFYRIVWSILAPMLRIYSGRAI